MYINNDIETVYKVLTNIRETIGDAEIFEAFTNYFNVDQLKGFAESLIDDYDLTAFDVGLDDDEDDEYDDEEDDDEYDDEEDDEYDDEEDDEDNINDMYKHLI